MKKQGKLFVISGPSGVGKGTLLNEVLKNHENIKYSVSYTTRAARPGEVHGKNYFFVSKDEFKNLISQDKFLEWAEFAGNYYGTSIDTVNETLASGKNIILEIEVQGALNVMEKCPDAVTLFVTPPNFETLKGRLIGRHTESEEAISKRLNTAEFELNNIHKFKYNLVNDDLELASKKLDEILSNEEAK